MCIMPTCKDMHTPEGSLSVAHLENDSFESRHNNSAKPQEREGNSNVFHDGLHNDGKKEWQSVSHPIKSSPTGTLLSSLLHVSLKQLKVDLVACCHTTQHWQEQTYFFQLDKGDPRIPSKRFKDFSR